MHDGKKIAVLCDQPDSRDRSYNAHLPNAASMQSPCVFFLSPCKSGRLERVSQRIWAPGTNPLMEMVILENKNKIYIYRSEKVQRD